MNRRRTQGPGEPDGRHLFWADGLVSNTSESFILNFTNPFALALGATNAQMGIMSSLANLAAALALLPGARLDERVQSRRRIVVATSVIHRLLLIAIAMLPLLFGEAAIYVFMALVACAASSRNWATLPGPRAHRRPGAAAHPRALFRLQEHRPWPGRADRHPLAGRLAESIGLPGGYQVSFVLAALIGLARHDHLQPHSDPPPYSPPTEVAAETQPILDLLRSHPRFAAFSAVAVLWNLSIMVAGPYFSVYIVRDLGAGPTLIGLLAASASLFNIVGQRLWGQLNDRKGPNGSGVTGLLIPLVPMPSLYRAGACPWFLIGVEAISGSAGPATAWPASTSCSRLCAGRAAARASRSTRSPSSALRSSAR